MSIEISPKQKLKSGERLNGCWIEAFSPITAEIMAMSGYDTAMIDLEHGPGSILDAISMMQAVSNHGCAPLIRATSSDGELIKRILDIGPAGIMVPNLQSAEHAWSVVASCRYGPVGTRGAAPPILRATHYGMRTASYVSDYEKDLLIIGQIESKQAVDEIDAIAAVEGLDMLFIGPVDLSASLGALGEFDRPEFVQAFETIESATLKAGKWLGSIPFHDWDAKRLFGNGHHFVISGADTLLLREAAEKEVAALKSALN